MTKYLFDILLSRIGTAFKIRTRIKARQIEKKINSLEPGERLAIEKILIIESANFPETIKIKKESIFWYLDKLGEEKLLTILDVILMLDSRSLNELTSTKLSDDDRPFEYKYLYDWQLKYAEKFFRYYRYKDRANFHNPYFAIEFVTSKVLDRVRSIHDNYHRINANNVKSKKPNFTTIGEVRTNYNYLEFLMDIFPSGKTTQNFGENIYNSPYMLLDEDFFLTWINFYVSFDTNQKIKNIELHLGVPYRVGILGSENESKDNLVWEVHFREEEISYISRKTIQLIESKLVQLTKKPNYMDTIKEGDAPISPKYY